MTRILQTHTEYVGPDNIFTEAEQIDQCCEAGTFDECVEDGRVSVYESAEFSEEDQGALLSKARAENPGVTIVGVQIEDVGPDGPCGNRYEEWVDQLACCDEATEIAWDEENSAEVIADNSTGFFVIVGGRSPFTVSVRGNGFYLDPEKTFRDGVIGGRNIPVYTGNSCGYCHITVTDGCSSVSGGVRSTNGRWVQEYHSQGGINGDPYDPTPPYPGGCPGVISGIDYPRNTVRSYVAEGFFQDKKIVQYFGRGYGRAYTARRPYSVALDECANYDCANYQPEERLAGSCFEFVAGCEECGDCDGTTDGQSERDFSYNPGRHAWISKACTEATGWCYSVKTCSVVTATNVYKWIC
jgi:hypothetical protein